MKKEQKDCVALYFNLFKEAMKEEGLIFGIVMDKKIRMLRNLHFLIEKFICQSKKRMVLPLV